ncbi:MAG: hypothetical protein ACOCXJ_08915, partial [Planctomycetota bacterium]
MVATESSYTPAALFRLAVQALARHERLWPAPERALLISAAQAEPVVQELLWRLLQRRPRAIPAARLPQAPVPAAVLAAALASGWLEEVRLADDPLAASDSLSAADCGGGDKQQAVEAVLADPGRAAAVQAAHGPFLRLSPAARQLAAGLAPLARGDWQAQPSDLVRVAMGQLQVPGGTPLARSLAGTRPDLDPAPVPDSEALLAALSARQLREQGCDTRLFDTLLE